MADADTIYRVLTVYSADASRAKHEGESLAVVLDHVINLYERAKGAVEHILELSSAAESAHIAMAGLVNASGFSHDFTEGLAMSSELMKTMRVDAAALSGTYEQMQAIFQTMIPVIHEAGQSLMSGEKMAGKVMEFGNTFGIPAEFIGREFRQMMEGRASIRNALFKDISSYMGGITGAEFNQLDMAKKWELVNKAMEKFAPMFAAVGETFKAQESTAESYFNQLVRIGGGALFDGLKGELKAINEWYRANQSQVDEYVRKLGVEIASKIKSGFEIAKEVFSFLIDHRDILIGIAEAYAAIKIGEGIGGLAIPNIGASAGKDIAHDFGVAIEGLAIGTIIAKQMTDYLDRPGGLMDPAGPLAHFLHTDQAKNFDEARRSQAADFAQRIDNAEERARQFSGSPHADSKNYREEQEKLVKFLEPTLAPIVESIKASNAYTSGRGGTGQFDPGAYRSYMQKQGQPAEFVAGQVAYLQRAFDAANSARVTERLFGHGDPIKDALNARGKPVTQHTTNIGAINNHITIMDSEDPARVVQKLITTVTRRNLEHPAQSPSVAVYR